jgi:predicted nucleic acid-binding protein
MSRVILLDNEPVQALGDPAHPKHGRVVGHAQVVARRKARAVPISIAVPTAVRVEAGWDRTDSAWAFVNQLRITDVLLDTSHANAAAGIGKRTGVSVADAHLGAAMQSPESDRVTVVTSDPRDMRVVAEGKHIEVVAL